MKKIKFIFIVLSFFMINNVHSMTYKEFKSFLRMIDIADRLIENNKYVECLTVLKKWDKKNIPFGLEPSYYANVGECNLHLNKIKEAKQYFILAFKYGLPRIGLTQVELNSDTTKVENVIFFKKLKENYDSIVNSSKTEEKIKLNTVISNMCRMDQAIRFDLGNARKKRDTLSINKCTRDLTITDSINQIIYDSICNKYNWITRDLYFYNTDIKPLIVIYHSEQSVITKYLKKGYELAEKNKIYWTELLYLQQYAIFKDVIYQKPDDVFIIETLEINDIKNNPNKFEFVMDALFEKYIEHIKNYPNKKIELYLNSNLKDSNGSLLKKINAVRNELIKLGAKENQIIVNENKYIIYNSKKTNNTVGVKFL
jgi:hypothetical protein